MGFQVRRICDKELFTGKNTNENVYTLLIGNNGCGKSHLLVDISNYYRKLYSDVVCSQDIDLHTTYKQYLEGYQSWDCIIRVLGSSIPKKLICASTSQFEKFCPEWRLKKDLKVGGFYSYIGSKPYIPDHQPSTRIASSAINQLLKSDIYDKRKLTSLRRFLKEFGFTTKLALSIESTISFEELNNYKRDIALQPETQVILKRALEFFEPLEITELLLELELCIDNPEYVLNISESGITLNVAEFKTSKFSTNAPCIDQSTFSLFLQAGFITVKDIQTLHTPSPERVGSVFDLKVTPLEKRSSGEQCLFLLFLGLISSIEDNSLILIDEPEISLHPSWQQRFVSILHDAFDQYNGCHFIIATHSPLILSDLGGLNSYILDMTSNELISGKEHQARSSDYQLANVFHNPGQNNEYLISQAIEVIDSICEGAELSEENNLKAEKLFEIQKLLKRDDKAHVLIRILKETIGRVQ